MNDIKIELPSQVIFHIGGLAVTNSMLTSVLVSVIVAVVLIAVARRTVIKPNKGLGFVVETTVDLILSQMTEVLGTREKATKYFPLIATFFFFILFNNWLGLIPGFTTITWHGEELFRRATTDLNTTIALALISVILTQIYAIRELGVVGNIQRYFHGNAMMKSVGVMEIFLEFTRILSFSFRLFGNIFAGEVLLIVISALVPLVGPTPFLGLELFVGFIQAYVFAILTLVFISISTTPVEHEHHNEERSLSGFRSTT